MRRVVYNLFCFVAVLVFAACDGGASYGDAAGAGITDAGVTDAGMVDAGGADDVGSPDAGFVFEPSVAKMIRDTSHHHRMIMAHRGGAGESPENTMGAYAHAVAIPVASIEIDTALSKDGVIVVFHDADLDKATDCTGPLVDRTFAELQLCEVDIYSYETFPDPATRTIPTLDEVFAYLKGKTLINLDAKEVPAALLVPKIKEHGLEDQIIYQAGSVGGCQALERDFPGIFCLAVIHAVADLDIVTATLATNFVELGDAALYTQENMDLIHEKGLKATMDIMGTYDLMPYQDKVAYMRLGADMFQSDLPTQWKRVVDTLNR